MRRFFGLKRVASWLIYLGVQLGSGLSVLVKCWVGSANRTSMVMISTMACSHVLGASVQTEWYLLLSFSRLEGSLLFPKSLVEIMLPEGVSVATVTFSCILPVTLQEVTRTHTSLVVHPIRNINMPKIPLALFTSSF